MQDPQCSQTVLGLWLSMTNDSWPASSETKPRHSTITVVAKITRGADEQESRQQRSVSRAADRHGIKNVRYLLREIEVGPMHN
jgi:hypothetical protein